MKQEYPNEIYLNQNFNLIHKHTNIQFNHTPKTHVYLTVCTPTNPIPKQIMWDHCHEVSLPWRSNVFLEKYYSRS
jgi:hypothetical protein